MTREIMGLLERIRGLEFERLKWNQKQSDVTKKITQLRSEIDDLLDAEFMDYTQGGKNEHNS